MATRSFRILALLAVWFGCARACNVPVFLYALQQWPADAYELVVYHQEGRIPPDAEQMLQEPRIGRHSINLSIRRVAADSADGKRHLQQNGVTTLPWMELYYPAHVHIAEPLWSGPCTPAHLASIFHSPSRQQVSEKIVAGDAVVWILLTAGDPRRDSQAAVLIKATLERAGQELVVPEIGTDINGNPIPVTDFKNMPVSFSAITVDRSDPQEVVFVRMLLHSEPDLLSFDQPMAFPVFGRGRMMYALVGEGINEKNILEACRSAVAWCSCEIKALNPGVDLLLAADWSNPALARWVKKEAISPLVGLEASRPDSVRKKPGSFQATPVTVDTMAAPEPQERMIAPGVAKEPEPALQKPANSARLLKNLLVLAGGGGILIFIFSLVMILKKRGSKA